MHWINWLIVVVYLVWVVVDGIKKSKDTDTVSGYFIANKSLAWWVVGLSVMATHLSAVTMIGTPGQGATDGIRFIQLYLGLPLAMVILGVTIVPLLHGSGVYTAYEYLERRFDARTRCLTAFLFLISRGLSVGAIMAAPGIVFSAVFGIPLVWAVALIGVPTVIYTMVGGVQAVAWADVKQMVLIVIALFAIMVVLIVQMPVNPDEALKIAGATGRLRVFDFSFDMSERYTFWSGVIGGTFLMLSYFGTDQSQVQRYLAARSAGEAKSSLLMSAYWKIPLQALVLLVGVGVFVYYQFVRPPLLYNPAQEAAVIAERGAAYDALQTEYAQAFTLREDAAREVADASGADAAAAMEAFVAREAEIQTIRGEALSMVEEVTGEASADVNYIITRFVLSELPIGLAGLRNRNRPLDATGEWYPDAISDHAIQRALCAPLSEWSVGVVRVRSDWRLPNLCPAVPRGWNGHSCLSRGWHRSRVVRRWPGTVLSEREPCDGGGDRPWLRVGSGGNEPRV